MAQQVIMSSEQKGKFVITFIERSLANFSCQYQELEPPTTQFGYREKSHTQPTSPEFFMKTYSASDNF